MSSSTKHISKLAAIAAAGVGMLVMLGWVLNIGVLKTVVPGSVDMKFNTAFAFTLSGAGLWLSIGQEKSRAALGAARILAAGVVLLAVGTLTEYRTGKDVFIDQLFFHDATKTPLPGRMAPQTALNFLFTGVSLLLLKDRRATARALTSCLIFCTLLLSTLALAGHLYQAAYFVGLSRFTGMAIHTSILFLFLGVGILLERTDCRLKQVLNSSDSGGIMLRRLLPTIFLVPLVLGLFAVQGERHGFYNVQERACLLVTSQIILLFFTVRACGYSLQELDIKRAAVNERREMLLEELRVASGEINQLNGLLPICAHCKKVRDDQGYWNHIEHYIEERSEATFSHGICNSCLRDLYPDIAENVIRRIDDDAPSGQTSSSDR